MAHIGAYKEMVVALVAEIPGRLAERATTEALRTTGQMRASGLKRPGKYAPGTSVKHQRRGGGHYGRGRGNGEWSRQGNPHY